MNVICKEGLVFVLGTSEGDDFIYHILKSGESVLIPKSIRPLLISITGSEVLPVPDTVDFKPTVDQLARIAKWQQLTTCSDLNTRMNWILDLLFDDAYERNLLGENNTTLRVQITNGELARIVGGSREMIGRLLKSANVTKRGLSLDRSITV